MSLTAHFSHENKLNIPYAEQQRHSLVPRLTAQLLFAHSKKKLGREPGNKASRGILVLTISKQEGLGWQCTCKCAYGLQMLFLNR